MQQIFMIVDRINAEGNGKRGLKGFAHYFDDL